MDAVGVETFLAVARSHSLSQAAQELSLAQTTVSKRLKVLEHFLGYRLIERGKGVKQIRLTTAGEEFFNLAERWSMLAREAKVLQSQGPKLSLVVGAVDSLNTFVLPQVYRAVNKHQPAIKLQIRTLHSIELYTEVEKKQVDIGFALRERVHPNVQVIQRFSSPMVVLRLAATSDQTENTVHPSDLDPNHELYMPWGQQFQIWHERWWDPLSPSRVKLDNATLLLNLLQETSQWAFVPLWIAQAAQKHGDYSVYRLTDPPPHYTCYQLTHKYPTQLTEQAMAIFNDYFKLTQPEQKI
ncbi:MAG: LysR family transcriptional regulator [Negativicutes bacterium]|nr:LysR family transcriptional regulator [Negativicutes bacterium]